MIPNYCKRILDAEKLATAGPWSVVNDGLYKCSVGAPGFGPASIFVCDLGQHGYSKHDGNFIATTRTDAPKAARGLEIAVAALEKMHEKRDGDTCRMFCPACTALSEIFKLEDA